MLTDRTWPTVGQKLVHGALQKGGGVTAEVVSVDRERGQVTVRVGFEVYSSLSAAARSITGRSTNGWVYWGLKRGKPPS